MKRGLLLFSVPRLVFLLPLFLHLFLHSLIWQKWNTCASFDGLSSLMSKKWKGLSLTLINLLLFIAPVKVKGKWGVGWGGVGWGGKGEVKCSGGAQSFSFNDNQSNDVGDGMKVIWPSFSSLSCWSLLCSPSDEETLERKRSLNDGEKEWLSDKSTFLNVFSLHYCQPFFRLISFVPGSHWFNFISACYEN